MRRFAPVIVICLLLIASSVAVRAAILTVPQSYPSISAALAAAHNGDSIKISPKTGSDPTYHESIAVTLNTLSIIGLSGATMDGTGLADGSGFGPTAIVVSGNGVTISGLTIQNYDFFPVTSGIELDGSNDTVTGCTLTGNGFGLIMDGSNGSASGNNASSNRVFGALISGSSNIFQNNTANSNGTAEFSGDGGVLIFSGGNTVQNSTVSGNFGEGIHVGTGTSEFGGPAVTAGYVTGNTVSGNSESGIALNESENQMVKNNIVSGNGIGISLLDFSRRCTINRNTVTGSLGSGILLVDGQQIHDCTISQNIVNGNGLYGIETGSDPFDASGLLSPNTFKANSAHLNAVLDLVDHSFNGSSVLNIWNNNSFDSTNAPGVIH